MRFFIIIFFFCFFHGECQNTTINLELHGGEVLPTAGYWTSAQLNVESQKIRISGGIDFAKYDRVNARFLESRKYSASLNNGYIGVGYKWKVNKLLIVPSFGLFAGAGFVKKLNDVDGALCSGCSNLQPPIAVYAWRITKGFRFGISSYINLSRNLRAGASIVYYPFIFTTLSVPVSDIKILGFNLPNILESSNFHGRMAGALQLSLAYTLWKEK